MSAEVHKNMKNVLNLLCLSYLVWYYQVTLPLEFEAIKAAAAIATVRGKKEFISKWFARLANYMYEYLPRPVV